MNTVIEQQRQTYENIERLELAIVDLMMQDLTKHRYKLLREQKIGQLLSEIENNSQLLQTLESDLTGLRQQEAKESTGQQKFDAFYKHLAEVQAFHCQNPDTVIQPPELDYLKYQFNPEELEAKQKAKKARMESYGGADNNEEDGEQKVEEDDIASKETFVDQKDEQKLDTMFSGDERYGRYVDLNEFHDLYLNLKNSKRLSYVDYLREFHKFGEYPRQFKINKQYRKYIDGLYKYLEGYFARAMPLFDFPQVKAETEEEFAQQWSQQTVSGWRQNDKKATKGLYCVVCNKHFEKDTTCAAHMKSRKHQKIVSLLTDDEIEDTDALIRDMARKECIISKYYQVVASRIQDTKANIERRQLLTEEERRREIVEEEDDSAVAWTEDQDEKDGQIYNPLNLPMGWDGKPIPYWLYKLHGLGVKFTCEICGNSIYRGRKAYEKHFQESKHATNMRRLGIPNTREFNGVSAIEEALALWERVKRDKKKEAASADTIKEYEDDEGNVFNKKTYYDLKRQGLI